ncbi:MAG: uroporphyrinogen-III synthase [Bacteroidetes bacterium]|nr:uroporphyrinogen-III synthase [Bacteroidota bacterium]
MAKNGHSKGTLMGKKIRKILITQPRPESDRSPYFELARKFQVQMDFHPFINLEPVLAKDFRRQKVDIATYTSVIFTSRNAIDHYFRICEELKVPISQDAKYFCISEAVALYLQKFILYRKRKVFFGSEGTNRSLFEVINRHKTHERFLYPCSENQQDNEIVNWLKASLCDFSTPFLYRTISNDLRHLPVEQDFDVICFFTPSGVKSLFDNFPTFSPNGKFIGAFGNNTSRAIEDAGLNLHIKAPDPEVPSMVAALDRFLKEMNGP